MIRFIKKWWDKFEDWMWSEEEDEEISIEDLVPPDSGLQKVLWNLSDAFENWAKSKRRSPFLVEFIIQNFILAFYMIVALVITLLCFGVYYLIVGSIDKDFLLVILILLAALPCLNLLFQLVYCPVFLLSLMDRIFNGRTKIRRMSLTIIRPFIISFDNFYCDIFSSLDYVFDYLPCPCKLYYFPLEDEHKPKTSKVHQPPYFYQVEFRPRGKETKFIRFIMTQPKSNLFDQLYQLEPTMEFEVSYLRFSKLLKEIRPIEGYEYAEGVPEILKQINSMYP